MPKYDELLELIDRAHAGGKEIFANAEGVNTVSKERSAFADAAANDAVRVSKEAERIRDQTAPVIRSIKCSVSRKPWIRNCI